MADDNKLSHTTWQFNPPIQSQYHLNGCITCLLGPASTVHPCFWLHCLKHVWENFAGWHFLEEHATCCHSGIKHTLH